MLLGLRQCEASLFTNITWGTKDVFAQTSRRLDSFGWHSAVLEALHDIDEPADFKYLPATLMVAFSCLIVTRVLPRFHRRFKAES